VLGQIGDRLRYEDLLPETVERPLGAHRFRVLDLAAVIRTKEQARRDKDRAVLAIFRRTLHERGGTGSPEPGPELTSCSLDAVAT
jgi:hypothetical protein